MINDPEIGAGAARRGSVTACRMALLSLRVGASLALPPLSFCSGLKPAHDARWPADGTRCMAVPTSATRVSAVRRPTPGDGFQPGGGVLVMRQAGPNLVAQGLGLTVEKRDVFQLEAEHQLLVRVDESLEGIESSRVV